MHNLFPDKLTESTEDLPHDLEHLVLFELLPLHQLLQISILAEFCDDVETVLGAEHILKFDYIGMVESLQQVYLRKDGIFEVLIVGEGGQIDLLNGYLLLAFPLDALIHFTVDALSQALRGLVGVITDDLDDHFVHSLMFKT
jgi:hypothetical protein